MIRFGAAVSTSRTGREAARAAASMAVEQLKGAVPALAIVFAAPSYEDLDGVPAAVEAELGVVPLVGGTSGGAVFDERQVARRGVLVALVAGPHVRAVVTTAPIAHPSLLDVVPAGAQILRGADDAAREGFEEALCLVFAPALGVDGDSLVAAVRKGAGPRMQLAGGLTGDDFTFDRARVFAEGGARADRAALAGLYSRARLGVAARHGLRAVGPGRRVTRCDGDWLAQLAGRPALEVWAEDVRAAGGRPPAAGTELRVYLASHYPLGLEVQGLDEPVVRVPMEVRPDGSARLGPLAEGATMRVMRSDPGEMLAASAVAAGLARERSGGASGGGLLLACSGRLQVLGDRFADEPRAIAKRLGVPVAGACVFGEIARAHRDADAFHNSTAVVVAWPR